MQIQSFYEDPGVVCYDAIVTDRCQDLTFPVLFKEKFVYVRWWYSLGFPWPVVDKWFYVLEELTDSFFRVIYSGLPWRLRQYRLPKHLLHGSEAQNKTIIDHQLPRSPGNFTYFLHFLGKVTYRKKKLGPMRFEVCKTVKYKITFFGQVTPCILIKTYQNSGGKCCFLLEVKLSSFYTEHMGSKFIAGKLYLYFWCVGIWLKLHVAITDCVLDLLFKTMASNCITPSPLLLTHVSLGLEVHQTTFINFNVLSKSNTLHEENVSQERYQSSHDERHKQVKMQHIARAT